MYSKIKERAREAVLSQVEAERDGERIDTDLLRDVLEIFQEVGMGSLECYENDFEEELLKDTSAYYFLKAVAWIDSDSTPEYLAKTEERLEAEEARVSRYLHVGTKSKLLLQAETMLLQEHQSQLMEKEHSGCAALLKDGKKEDIARMYRLFGRIRRGLEPMAEIFRKHVEEEGLKLVREAGEAAEARKEREPAGGNKGAARDSGLPPEHAFIRNTIALHETFMSYVTDCFGGSSLFHKALKEAFESFCNKQVAGASAAELMASFCDTMLRKGGGERLSDEELDVVLDKVVRLLAYVSEKDLFSEFYRKKLARRLLSSTSASEDAEKGVLTRLKQQCGAQFTSKMEGMVQDLQMAKEKERGFHDWLEIKGKKLPLDMNVTVLTTGFWPTYRPVEIALPDGMMLGLEQFTRFHEETSNKTRRLTWQLGLGSVHVKASLDKTYEFVVNPLQASILLAFDTDDSPLTFNEIQERTKVPEDDLARGLHSLCLAKYKILTRDPAAGAGARKIVSRTDSFSVNTKFVDRARRIRVPLPPQDDRRKVQEDVDKDRKYAIDAAIVRIMKSRKVLTHSALIMEVVQQLQRMFQPDIKVIKRSIEGLIEREYLERDAGNQQMYKYMA